MIWYSVEEEIPLDTLNRPSLWLWDGQKVVQGGFVEGSRAQKYKNGYWFDLNFQPFQGVHAWREIMPEDVEPPQPPANGGQDNLLHLPKRRGI